MRLIIHFYIFGFEGSKDMKKIRKKECFICVLFFVLLYAAWIGDLLREDRLYSAWEKRRLEQKPKFSMEAVLDGSYGEDYEAWLMDQFPLRDWWVGVKNRLELLLGKRELEGIYIGRDGYLFSEKEQTADWDALEEKMQKLFGVDRVSRIHVPAAGAILREKRPMFVSFSGREDAVFWNLYQHREEAIYFRTDHHWTMRGAYYAYEAWAREQGMKPLVLSELPVRVLKEDFLGTHYGKIHYAKQKDVMEFYDPGTACEAVYDLGESDVMGLYQEEYLETEDAYRFFLDGNHGVVEITGGKGEGHLIVLKDSYANCLVPFLTAHYERITVIDPRYFRADIGEWVKEQKDGVRVLIVGQDTSRVIFEKQLKTSSFCAMLKLEVSKADEMEEDSLCTFSSDGFYDQHRTCAGNDQQYSESESTKRKGTQ